MGYKLLMAEKPSVAADIAKVLIGESHMKKRNGYYEGNGLLVTWAVGHLVGLAEPEDYGFISMKDMYGGKAQEAAAELPLIPPNLDFKLVVLKPTKDQFDIVKGLIHREDVDEIINCGDMGAEGHILQWFIREKAGCKKPVRRFCATSMTDEAIKDAYAHLRREEDFALIIKGEYCKKKADWILGMSLSRAESLKYHANISVGRVQSPTLYFIVSRYLEVTKFKKKNYYGLALSLSGEKAFTVFWNKDSEGIFAPDKKDTEGRVLDRAAVQEKAEKIKSGGAADVTDVTVQKRATDRPQLYDITELQRDANRRYGYTAQLTLDTAQALYETQKVLSYPRTDSRYITSDLAPYMEKRIKAIGGLPGYGDACRVLLSEGLTLDKRIVDDKKVTDHHALLPTEKIAGFDLNAMEPTPEEKKKGVTKEGMKNVLTLVLTRLVVAFSKPYFYEQTNVTIQAQDVTFHATGKRPISPGWTAVQEKLAGKEKDEEAAEDAEQVFPALKKGQSLTVSDCVTVQKTTTPPKLHTEATLLTAMENAGATVEGGNILKGKGIGTQATRAGIINTLFQRGYVQNKEKTSYIIPTSMGLGVIRCLPPELYSPKITADWETRIAEIAEGKQTEQNFFDAFLSFIREKTTEVRETDTGVSFAKEKEAVGVCPFCGGNVCVFKDEKTKETRYYCVPGDRKEEYRDMCRFSISDRGLQTFMKPRLSEKNMKELLNRGFTRVKVYYSNGTKNAVKKIAVEKREKDGKWYANLKIDWNS